MEYIMLQKMHVLISAILLGVGIVLFSSLSCERVPPVTGRCDLTAHITFVNTAHDSLGDSLRVLMVDSTYWYLVSGRLLSHETSMPDTLAIGDSSIAVETLHVAWDYEQNAWEDTTSTICSTDVDLDIRAVVYMSDTILDTVLSRMNIPLGCLTTREDTAFADSFGVRVRKFSYDTTIFIP
jgi:hypothetical protein